MSDSIWKKEISFGRKRDAKAAPTPAPAEAKQSIWKKEITLGRKKKAETPAVEPVEAEPEVAATVEPAPGAPPPAGYSWLTDSFDPDVSPPAQSAPDQSVEDVSAPDTSVPAEPVADVSLPAVSVEVPSVPDVSAPVETAVDMPAGETALVEPPATFPRVPEVLPAPAVSYMPPPAVPVSGPSVEDVSEHATPEPDVPTQDMPIADVSAKDVSEKVPFWKKELTLGGKPKARKAGKPGKAPKQAKQPKPARAQAAKTPKQSKANAKQTLVGLKIGASQIAAARVQNGGEPQLLQLAREPLEDGIVVGGELRDLEALAETLKGFFAKHKLPKRGVRLGIANNRIGVRTFEISGIDDPTQLANAIRFRAQETLPIPLEEAVLDWQVLSETVDEATGQVTRRVLLVVAYRELVDRYVAACKKAGIRLDGIDLEAFAMLRALGAPAPADGYAAPAQGAQVVVNVGHDRSTFAVSDGRVCEFTRVLGWGGSALSVAIARQLDVTPSEADPIKHALSLPADETPAGIAPESLEVAREAVRRELQSFARELVSSLRFYQNQPGSLGIGELVVTGGTAHVPGVAEELERLIGVPVRVGDPLARVRVAKKLKTPERVGSLAVAIGLGIED